MKVQEVFQKGFDPNQHKVYLKINTGRYNIIYYKEI